MAFLQTGINELPFPVMGQVGQTGVESPVIDLVEFSDQGRDFHLFAVGRFSIIAVDAVPLKVEPGAGRVDVILR